MPRQPKCDDQIVEAINWHWKKFCLPPSLDDLVENTCIASKNTMYLAIRRLARQGYISLVWGKAVPIGLKELVQNSDWEIEYESEKSQEVQETS